jgi:hypothetical protein
MNDICRQICFSCIALLLAAPLSATERQQIATVKFVYPLADGNFVIGLDADSSFCTSTSSPNKYYHVYVGQYGVTADGSSKIYASALLALASRQTINVIFDDTTAYCYVNRVAVSN